MHDRKRRKYTSPAPLENFTETIISDSDDDTSHCQTKDRLQPSARRPPTGRHRSVPSRSSNEKDFTSFFDMDGGTALCSIETKKATKATRQASRSPTPNDDDPQALWRGIPQRRNRSLGSKVDMASKHQKKRRQVDVTSPIAESNLPSICVNEKQTAAVGEITVPSDREPSLTPPPQLPHQDSNVLNTMSQMLEKISEQLQPTYLPEEPQISTTMLDPVLQNLGTGVPPEGGDQVITVKVKFKPWPVREGCPKPLAYKLLMQFLKYTQSQSFEVLMRVTCTKWNVSDMRDMIFVYEGTPLFPRGTPASVKMDGKPIIEAYIRSEYDALRRAQESEQKPVHEDHNVGGDAEKEGNPCNELILLKMQDSTEITKIKAKKGTTVEALIAAYQKLRSISHGTCRLMLDGEVLDSSMRLEQLGLEDGDLLEVQ
ncbi:hypothetical protein SpCBS45565_g07505 [Spizellomyces sp. 'palustris']|nr:hypothetical protein SpCBS45565_g07505 [Spizellomyces sp. 'palustris']